MTRRTLFEILLFLHVMGAISAVGPSLTYALWRARAESAGPQTRAFVLRTVSWVDRRVATPSFGLQAVTGVGLVLVTGVSVLHTAWLVMGIGLYVLTAAFAGAVYVPVVRRQRELAERAAAEPSEGHEAAYRAGAARARTMGLVAVGLTVAILYFMIVKPTLWSPG